MIKRNTLLPAALVVLLSLTGACTNDTLDDGDSADVILEVELLDNPPVTASLDQMTGVCTFTIVDWSFDVANQPKNTLATGPFNDIELVTVTITYDWINAGLDAIQTNPRIIGLGGAVIPADSTASVNFTPIAFDDLTLAHSGRTANLTLTFRARTIEGTDIFKTVLRQLNIEGCA